MSSIDFGIIVIFLAGLCVYGLLQGRKNQSSKDYFLGSGTTPWWVAMFSIVATETSVLTFISVPGLAYRGDWFFLQLGMGYIVGRVLVSAFLIPQYFKSGVMSIYEVIGEKFGTMVQKVASLTFLITRIFADGVRFLATAVIVQVVTGWSIEMSVLIIGIVTVVYTLSGGIKTILWVDSFQFVLYLLGGIIVIYTILTSPNFQGLDSLVLADKMKVFRFGTENMFTDAWFFGSAFIGGTLLSFASHGADHMMVQRVLSCKDISDARKAMIGSGLFVLIQFLVFLFAGSLIWSLFGGVEMTKDREFSTYIVNHLPVGLKGILLAGVLSAAMSTLSSSINSLSSSTIADWFGKNTDLKLARKISLFWAIVLIGMALIFDEGNTSIVVLGLKIASYTYGGLLGLFLLTKFKINFHPFSIILGLVSSLMSVFYMASIGLAWTWFIGFSVLVNILVALSTNKLFSLNK
ncbi:MAG: sodium:solute symporter [Candidatus Marinimicrobia bacterium]|nr:sodium:solute symporter [Candidatus Neomarinimicrobiota bacterium]